MSSHHDRWYHLELWAKITNFFSFSARHLVIATSKWCNHFAGYMQTGTQFVLVTCMPGPHCSYPDLSRNTKTAGVVGRMCQFKCFPASLCRVTSLRPRNLGSECDLNAEELKTHTAETFPDPSRSKKKAFCHPQRVPSILQAPCIWSPMGRRGEDKTGPGQEGNGLIGLVDLYTCVRLHSHQCLLGTCSVPQDPIPLLSYSFSLP